MGSAIKTMGIINAVVQGLTIVVGAIAMQESGFLVFIVGAFFLILSTMLILAVGEILEMTDALCGAVSTLTYKVEQLEKGLSGEKNQAVKQGMPAAVGAQDYKNLPAWKRVELEQAGKEQ